MNKNLMPFSIVTKSHKKLLEYLFKRGLSSKTDSVIEGLSEFFKYAFLNKHKNQSEFIIIKSLGDALVECLTSSEYKIVAIAYRVLRDYINSTYEIPNGCIQKLIEVLNTNVQTFASEAAFTLACIGCSKPDRNVLRQLSSDLFYAVDGWLCLKCRGGYIRVENAQYVVS